MPITERLALLVTLDAQGAIKGFNDLGKAADRNLGKTDQRLDQFASRFQKAGAGLLATAGLASVGLYKAGQAASSLEQAMGGTEAVFGDASAVIDEFAKKAAQAAGLSEAAFRTATTSIGGQLKGLGFTVEEAASQAVDLTQVAADLSATYGGTTAEAVAALGAAFRGEADPAERFNLFLNQTRVNAKAVELGLAETTASVDANAKALATLELITEQSADAQGQFAREADTAAGAQARFKAASENLLASLGGAVAPVLASVADRVGGLVEGFNNLSEPQQRAISRLALFTTGAIGAAGALSFTVGKVIDMRENLSKLTGPFRSAEGGLNRLGKATAGLGIAGVVAGLASIANESSKTVVDVDRLADSLANLTDANENQTKLSILAAEQLGNLDEIVSQLAEQNATAATSFIDLAEEAGIGADKIARFRQEVTDNRRVQAQAIVDQRENAAAIDETVDSLDQYGGASGRAAGGVDRLSGSLDEQKTALDRVKESLDLYKSGLEAAFDDLSIEEATDNRAQAFEDLASRFADAQESVTEARRRLEDLRATPSEDRSANFNRDVADAEKALQDALAETSRSLTGNSEAALENREDLRQVAEAIGAIITKHREEGASLDELKRIRDIEKLALVEQLDQLGFNREEIARYVEAIEAIPLTKVTVFDAQTEKATAKVNDLLGRIARLNETGQASGVDVLQAESQLQRSIGQGGQVNNVTIINPTQEPASTSIRKVRGELVA